MAKFWVEHEVNDTSAGDKHQSGAKSGKRIIVCARNVNVRAERGRERWLAGCARDSAAVLVSGLRGRKTISRRNRVYPAAKRDRS